MAKNKCPEAPPLRTLNRDPFWSPKTAKVHQIISSLPHLALHACPIRHPLGRQLLHLSPQDRPRGFPLKGTRDALGNQERRGRLLLMICQCFAFAYPVNYSAECWTPSTPMRLDHHGCETQVLLATQVFSLFEVFLVRIILTEYGTRVVNANSVSVCAQSRGHSKVQGLSITLHPTK